MPARYPASTSSARPSAPSTRPRAKRSRQVASPTCGNRAHSASSTVVQGPRGSCSRLGGTPAWLIAAPPPRPGAGRFRTPRLRRMPVPPPAAADPLPLRRSCRWPRARSLAAPARTCIESIAKPRRPPSTAEAATGPNGYDAHVAGRRGRWRKLRGVLLVRRGDARRGCQCAGPGGDATRPAPIGRRGPRDRRAPCTRRGAWPHPVHECLRAACHRSASSVADASVAHACNRSGPGMS